MTNSRDSINHIWGDRVPYFEVWRARVDERTTDAADSWIQSACVLCSNGCGLDIGVKDGRVVGVRGRADDHVNRGRLGPKGLHGWEANNSADRLRSPLISKNGKLESASWDRDFPRERKHVVGRYRSVRGPAPGRRPNQARLIKKMLAQLNADPERTMFPNPMLDETITLI